MLLLELFTLEELRYPLYPNMAPSRDTTGVIGLDIFKRSNNTLKYCLVSWNKGMNNVQMLGFCLLRIRPLNFRVLTVCRDSCYFLNEGLMLCVMKATQNNLLFPHCSLFSKGFIQNKLFRMQVEICCLHTEACACTIVLLLKHMAAHAGKCDN